MDYYFDTSKYRVQGLNFDCYLFASNKFNEGIKKNFIRKFPCFISKLENDQRGEQL